MRKPSIGKSLLATLATVLFATACIIGCGNTDGGSAVETYAGLGTHYVSDGGAGGTISIDVKGSVSVGETTPFVVSVRDSQGAPLQFVRVFCESEHGIAIVEPSKGGTAFEHTDTYGNMSGVIGGMSPGSYVLECRAPIEYNLIARTSVKITGEIPAGFTGWPGAAGGNLGGGYSVDPDISDGGLAITRISFTDMGDDSLYLDIFKCSCVSGTGDDAETTPEPWFENTYKITVKNGTSTDIAVDKIKFEVFDGSGALVATSVQSVALTLGQGESVSYEGQLTAFGDSSFQHYWANTTAGISKGSYSVKFTVSGEALGTSESASTSASQNIIFDNIINCDEGQIYICS